MATQELVEKVRQAILSGQQNTLNRDPCPTAQEIATILGVSDEAVVQLIRNNYPGVLQTDPLPTAQLIVAALTQPG